MRSEGDFSRALNQSFRVPPATGGEPRRTSMASPRAWVGEHLFLESTTSDALASDPATPGSTRRRATVGIFAGAASALFGSAARTGAKRKKKKKKSERSRQKSSFAGDDRPHVALGAYVPRALDDPSVLKSFSKSIGRDVDYAVWYETWSNGSFGSDARAYLDSIDDQGLSAFITWEPYDPHGPTIDQPTYRLSRIINGSFNAYIDGWANGLKGYRKPVFLSFAHEMNGGWFPWGAGVNGNKPGEYIDAWRHIHDRFASRGATNVRWIWNPNVVFPDIPASLADVYPGNGYVDWFGMNGYNWGTSVFRESCSCRSSWETFDEVFAETYRQLVNLGNKPIVIGETASSEEGGKKRRWIKDAFLREIPGNYPRIRAVTWFNEVATGLDTVKPGVVKPTAKVDWRVTSSAKSRKAFAAAVKHAYYQESLTSIS